MARILVGASSWANHSLVKESGWYPRKSMKAAERLGYYTSKLPLVEVDATYRFPPTPELARQWVDRTPPGFTMDVKAWSLLTGQATIPASLWEDLQTAVRPEARDSRRLYAGHLTAEALDEAWVRFEHSLRPLHDAGRLGAVMLELPHWLKAGDTGRALLGEARRRLPDYRLTAEFRHHSWVEGDCEATLSSLEELDIGFVCVDGPGYPRVIASTSSLAVLRFYGRAEEDGWPFAYRYTDEELSEWLPAIAELGRGADEVHVLFSNAVRDFGVRNAEAMQEMLSPPETTRLFD